MEIRNVVNEVKNEYPKMEQVSKKQLSNSIPNKWLKVGLFSLGIVMVMKNKVFASSSTIDLNSMNMVAGGLTTPIPTPIKICNITLNIVKIVSVIVFIITGLSILITKIESKKQPEHKKVKKWVKIIFFISIILFILTILIPFIINK